MDRVNYKHILNVLEKENRWLTFDELYSEAQSNCDWTDFALQLEYLVEQGAVEYDLFGWMNIGCYRISGGYVKDEKLKAGDIGSSTFDPDPRSCHLCS